MSSVILEDNLSNLSGRKYDGYQAFIYCYEGSCIIDYNGSKHRMSSNGCAVILNKTFLKSVNPSPDFVCKILYMEDAFLRQCEPHNLYVVQAMFALYSNPVIRLKPKDAELCKVLFSNFALRIADKRHKFYMDILRASANMLLLDIYNFHKHINVKPNKSLSSSNIMTKFIQMLDAKEYRISREVAYYAEKLNMGPKYLSEVAKKLTGYSALYWINRYAVQDIHEVLRSNVYSVEEIARMFNFTTASYLNRYVKRNLGVYPSELRGQ